MNIDARLCLAMLCPGDRSARDRSDPAASRFGNMFNAFASAGVSINSMLDSSQPNTCNWKPGQAPSPLQAYDDANLVARMTTSQLLPQGDGQMRGTRDPGVGAGAFR